MDRVTPRGVKNQAPMLDVEIDSLGDRVGARRPLTAYCRTGGCQAKAPAVGMTGVDSRNPT